MAPAFELRKCTPAIPKSIRLSTYSPNPAFIGIDWTLFPIGGIGAKLMSTWARTVGTQCGAISLSKNQSVTSYKLDYFVKYPVYYHN